MVVHNKKLLALFSYLVVTARALNVSPTGDATKLANAILGSGITLLSASYSGASDSSGTFTSGPQGIRDAAVLTSGDAVDTIPVGNNDPKVITSKIKGTPGSALCETLSASGGAAFDAAVLTMEVELSTGFDGFAAEFVFATEEYPEYIGSEFNDVFGIYVDDKQVAFDGNNAPITVNGPFFSSANVLQPPESGSAFQGSTPLLKSGAKAAPGKHTIVVAICDISDRKYDSSVFVAINACNGNDCKEGTVIVPPKPSDEPSTYASATDLPTGVYDSAASSYEPTGYASGAPISDPVYTPTGYASGGPISDPVYTPTGYDSADPISDPVYTPTGYDSADPISDPVYTPTGYDSADPISDPVYTPTGYDSADPISDPVYTPTGYDSADPISDPVYTPTGYASGDPVSQPTGYDTGYYPTSDIGSADPTGYYPTDTYVADPTDCLTFTSTYTDTYTTCGYDGSCYPTTSCSTAYYTVTPTLYTPACSTSTYTSYDSDNSKYYTKYITYTPAPYTTYDLPLPHAYPTTTTCSTSYIPAVTYTSTPDCVTSTYTHCGTDNDCYTTCSTYTPEPTVYTVPGYTTTYDLPLPHAYPTTTTCSTSYIPAETYTTTPDCVTSTYTHCGTANDCYTTYSTYTPEPTVYTVPGYTTTYTHDAAYTAPVPYYTTVSQGKPYVHNVTGPTDVPEQWTGAGNRISVGVGMVMAIIGGFVAALI